MIGMKRIGIHTITDYANYGNRLQNYAVQEILKSLDFEVETIVNRFPLNNVTVTFKIRLLRLFSQSPLILIKKITDKIGEHSQRALLRECKQKKIATFRAFTNKYIIETPFTISDNEVPEHINERYDFCVTGSDQIWNPNIRFGSTLDFLSYVSPEKRIAFSPSFGVSHIPDNYKDLYRKYLLEMKTLSVREDRGAEIIFQLCGQIATVLVDPTLMLTSDQWLAISKPATAKPTNSYLLTYFIGDISNKRMKILEHIADLKNLEIVQMNSLRDSKRYDADPAEFIDYIKNAEIVCTDSFHSSIFSIIMERPFVVFNREGKSAVMSSRIDTLLNKLNLQHRWLHNIKSDEDFFKVNFLHVPEIIENERNKFYSYLRNAFEI